MENELVLEVIQIENVVVVKVLQMDETFRSPTQNFISTNNFVIKSCECPLIDEKSIYVCGTETLYDNYYMCRNFYDTDKAKTYCDNLKEAVRQFNKRNVEENRIESENKNIKTYIMR